MLGIQKRAEDKRWYKYWIPYGYMRRHLANQYGLVVRGGMLVKACPGLEDVSGFVFYDVLPLWLVMVLQKCGSKQQPVDNLVAAEIEPLRRQIQVLSAELANEVRERNEVESKLRDEIDRLTVENLRLKVQSEAAFRQAGERRFDGMSK